MKRQSLPQKTFLSGTANYLWTVARSKDIEDHERNSYAVLAMLCEIADAAAFLSQQK